MYHWMFLDVYIYIWICGRSVLNDAWFMVYIIHLYIIHIHGLIKCSLSIFMVDISEVLHSWINLL